MVGYSDYSERMHPDMVDSWRCSSCDRLMYNTEVRDGQIVPRAGAPLPLYAGVKHPTVCSVCYEMYAALDRIQSTYWIGGSPAKLNPDNAFDVYLKTPLRQPKN
jgi:hypothetical protein